MTFPLVVHATGQWSVPGKTNHFLAGTSENKDCEYLDTEYEVRKYPTHFTGYGLGLYMQDYAGRQVYWHTGGAGGMVSNVCFVPEEKLGIAILTNNDNQGFFEDCVIRSWMLIWVFRI